MILLSLFGSFAVVVNTFSNLSNSLFMRMCVGFEYRAMLTRRMLLGPDVVRGPQFARAWSRLWTCVNVSVHEPRSREAIFCACFDRTGNSSQGF